MLLEDCDVRLYDWRDRWGSQPDRLNVSIVVPLTEDQYFREELTPEELEREYASLAKDLADVTGAEISYADGVDVGLGASWEAIGFLLGFASSMTTLTMAAIQCAPAVRKAIRHLRQRFKTKERNPSVILSIDALQVLVLDEIRATHNIEAESIRSIRHIQHLPALSEPRVEVQQTYAAFTITVEAEEDRFLRIWNYLVTPEGHVVNASDLRLPMPNASHWSDVELPQRMLPGTEPGRLSTAVEEDPT